MTQDTRGWTDTSICSDCGAELWPDIERAYGYGPETYLCFGCAERRGGVYEVDEDRWATRPDVSGLADERRPHS